MRPRTAKRTPAARSAAKAPKGAKGTKGAKGAKGTKGTKGTKGGKGATAEPAMLPSPRGPDRMPPLAYDALSRSQRAAVEEIALGPRGGVIGPFIPALRSPELMTSLQRLGKYLRYDNALGKRLTELAILVIARSWSQEFEWCVHASSAEKNGLDRTVIDAIGRGRRPSRLSADEKIVYELLHELLASQGVSDRLYDRAVHAFGEAGVVDLIAVAGYYTTLAMILNVARTPTPADAPRLPALAPKRRREPR